LRSSAAGWRLDEACRQPKLEITGKGVGVKLMRRRVLGAIALLVGVIALAPRASADDALWRAFRGRVVFSDVALAPAANFDSSATMQAAVRRIERSTVDQRSGFWRLHVLAFFDRPSETTSMVMRATDVSDPRAPREVRVFQQPVQRGERELRLDDFVVSPEMGFKSGGTYEIAVEAAPEEAETLGGAPETKKAGKADVYAKGVITLR